MNAIAFALAAVFFVPTIAHAQGGGGTVNPAPAPTIEARTPRQDTGSAATPSFNGALLPFDNQTLPTQANESTAQTSNSMPRNAAPASTPMARRMESGRGETVGLGHLAPNNGSGISQTAASMPPGAMKGTLSQQSADGAAQYMVAHRDRQLAALHARQSIRLARRATPSRPELDR